MLTRDGCRARIARLVKRLEVDWDAALLASREHVLYLGNFFPLPNSLNLHGDGFLLIERGGPVTLFTDNWLAGDAVETPPHELTSADEVVAVRWYDCQADAVARRAVVADRVAEHLRARGIRRLAAETAHLPARIASSVETVIDVEPALLAMRQRKDPDEISAIRRGIAAAEAIHSASRELLRPGITEIAYYAALLERATVANEAPFVLMCDVASGERAAKGGGGPTTRTLLPGETVILDIFPYVEGYRGDITNTLVVGAEPTSEQTALFDTVHAALEAAEKLLKPGTPANAFTTAIDTVYAERSPGDRLAHHAGHAIGLGHPEAPELVANTQRVIEVGNVLTLEPGIYGRPWGGVRLEHNYLITERGFERLSSHRLGLA